MTWVKLEKGNDWGATYYALPGEALKGGSARMSNGVKLEPSRRYSVRFPDGFVASCLLRSENAPRRVSDHGHTYHFTNQTVGALVEFHGLKLWVEVSDVELLREEL